MGATQLSHSVVLEYTHGLSDFNLLTSFPGKPRKTAEDRDFGDFSIFEDPEDPYSTFNFHYQPKPFDRLAKLNEFNTLLGEQTMKDVIKEFVKKRRERKAMNGVNGHY